MVSWWCATGMPAHRVELQGATGCARWLLHAGLNTASAAQQCGMLDARGVCAAGNTPGEQQTTRVSARPAPPQPPRMLHPIHPPTHTLIPTSGTPHPPPLLQYGTFSAEDACNFAVNIYEDGNVLSIVVDAGSHVRMHGAWGMAVGRLGVG